MSDAGIGVVTGGWAACVDATALTAIALVVVALCAALIYETTRNR